MKTNKYLSCHHHLVNKGVWRLGWSVFKKNNFLVPQFAKFSPTWTGIAPLSEESTLQKKSVKHLVKRVYRTSNNFPTESTCVAEKGVLKQTTALGLNQGQKAPDFIGVLLKTLVAFQKNGWFTRVPTKRHCYNPHSTCSYRFSSPIILDVHYLVRRFHKNQQFGANLSPTLW